MKVCKCFVSLVTLVLLISCLNATAEVEVIPDPYTTVAETLLTSQRGEQKDAWVCAILDSGAKNVKHADGVLSFDLCAFDPNLKALGSYSRAENPSAWRSEMLKNLASHRLTVSVALQADGTVSRKAAQAFISTVKQAAKEARTAFQNKDMTAALWDLFFPAPTNDRKPTAASLLKPSEAFEDWIADHADLIGDGDAFWASLFYVQRNLKVSTKNGPHAVTLTWDGASPETLLQLAYHTVSAELTAKNRQDRPSLQELPDLFDHKLADAAIQIKKGRLVNFGDTLDLLDLANGQYPAQYASYLQSFSYAATLERLQADYAAYPDEASKAFPKTGTLTTAPKKGRTVTVNIPMEGVSAYVQLRDADTDVIISDAFIAAGKSVNMKATEGTYYVQYAAGTAWYGPDKLFGPTGEYMSSDAFVLGKKKLTLSVMQDQEGIRLHEVNLSAFAAANDSSVHVPGALNADVRLGKYPANHPAIPGISSTTGLPASGEAYTPIVMVLDNAEDAYPHWGVSQADIIFQVPNAGSGATKLLALFADHYPEQAGPVRSGRASMLPAAMSFNAAFAFGGPPAVKDQNIDIEALMTTWKMKSTHRVYNMLQNNGFHERIPGLIRSHDLSCHVRQIHENLISKDVAFEERPFLFTDTPRQEGQKAGVIKVMHHGESADTPSNSASRAVFTYDEETKAYSRTNSSGLYLDRETGENVQFANVIVLRTKLSYEKNYVFLKKHLVGSGAADIFQNGYYIHGAWVRDSVDSRLIFVDDKGEELVFQRGKTFIVMTNEITEVVFTE